MTEQLTKEEAQPEQAEEKLKRIAERLYAKDYSVKRCWRSFWKSSTEVK